VGEWTVLNASFCFKFLITVHVYGYDMLCYLTFMAQVNITLYCKANAKKIYSGIFVIVFLKFNSQNYF
jgi:hypothetical protein